MSFILAPPHYWPLALKDQIATAFREGDPLAIRRALTGLESLDENLRGAPFRLRILRTCTLEALVPALRLALSALPCRPEISLAPLGIIEQELADDSRDYDATLIYWRLEDLAPDLAFADFSPESAAGASQGLFGRVESTLALA
ncbi:MAG: hypothetical protein HQL31_07255, partial [Planctomycetes bacterium]|nr:hypothetical protein [Planctomycetota bacterium]